MADLDDPRILAFLSAGTRTGKLGFTARDGRPLIAPIWFLVEGSGEDTAIVFNTGTRTAKGRAIARDPRLVLCVDLEEPPFAFVQIQGTATISQDTDDLLRMATALGARYMGAERAEEFGRRNAALDELLVRLHADHVFAQAEIAGYE
jgi:PPOX class probable F420-dependent enzyme